MRCLVIRFSSHTSRPFFSQGGGGRRGGGGARRRPPPGPGGPAPEASVHHQPPDLQEERAGAQPDRSTYQGSNPPSCLHHSRFSVCFVSLSWKIVKVTHLRSRNYNSTEAFRSELNLNPDTFVTYTNVQQNKSTTQNNYHRVQCTKVD